MTESERARPIRTFVLRQGRITQGQARAIATLAPRLVVPFSPVPIDLDVLFGRRAPKVVEIGFGMGETTAAIARTRPDIDYLGIEVHSPGVGALLRRIDEFALTNLRIVQHDAVEVLAHMIMPASLDALHIFFPDPWPKKRHHKRRLLQAPFVALLASRLKAGGMLHVATDWENYAEQALAVRAAERTLENTAAGYATRPDSRPPTKFESRGVKLGHGVWDIGFRRR